MDNISEKMMSWTCYQNINALDKGRTYDMFQYKLSHIDRGVGLNSARTFQFDETHFTN